MKLLLAYDGSIGAEAALDDLPNAGLPAVAEALVLSVAEVWLPPPPENETLSEYAQALQTHPQFFKAHTRDAQIVTKTETLARQAQQRLGQYFPRWQVNAEATYGSPAWEILSRAATFTPDLIVVGAHGYSALNRLWFGSISGKVLSEARCSVRVGRGKVEVDPLPPARIIIGFDGSPGALAAVAEVAARDWREGSEIRLLTARNQLVPTSVELFAPSMAHWVEAESQTEQQLIERLAEPYRQTLSAAGLKVSLQIKAGNPKQVLLEEAAQWQAGMIFVGANAFSSGVERFLLGSVSAAVAARAHCSVEVVKRQS